MKTNLPVTQIERPFPKGLRIVSKTDLKGIITYVNDQFVQMSGFSREELVGKNHNIIRHPDMPPQAFKWLWDTLKGGHPWRGIVKNRCKDGSHYWVSALVVPIIVEGKIIEFMSVRREPTRQQISEAEALYKELNETKASIGSKFERFRFRNLSLQTKLQILIQSTLLLVMSLGNYWIAESFRDQALNAAQVGAMSIANATIDGANMLMETGAIGDIDNRKLLIKKISSTGHIKSLRLVRAKQVVDQFGPGLPEEQIKDKVEQNAIDTKTPFFSLMNEDDGSPVFRAVVPYIVSHDFHGTDCMNCHQVADGSVNGASDISIDLKSDFDTLHAIQLKLIAGQVVLQFFLFFFIGWCIKQYVKRPMKAAMIQFQVLMEGRLDPVIGITGRDEMGELFCAIQIMQAYVQVMLDEMEFSANIIETRCDTLNSQVVRVADHSKQQQDHVQQISETMTKFTQSVSEVSHAATESASAAVSSQKIIEENNQRMEQSVQGTLIVVEAVQSSSRTISELKEEIQKIGDITKAIKEIADQTNLLALNAAIEAARAGEQGRGFAVVADEVRKLAERTTSSTAMISQMVQSIHSVSEAAVKAMDKAVVEVEKGIELAEKNGASLKLMTASSEQVTVKAQHIADASTEQYSASEEVAASLAQISDLVNENAFAAQDAKQAGEELAQATEELKIRVRHFEISKL
jgi:PAS domain S-box-containing protein